MAAAGAALAPELVAGSGATAGASAAGGMAGEAAAGGGQAAGVATRKPAAGARGKAGARGAAGSQGSAGPAGKDASSSKAGGGFFSQLGSFFGSTEQAVDSGLDEARGLRLTPPKKLTVNDGAGFLGGLLLYVLALNYIRYGKDGVTGWIAAKFVNRPWSPPDSGGDGEADA